MTIHQSIAQSSEPSIWRLTVEDFLLLDNNGSFENHAKAELLDGEIWVVNAIHSRHAAVQSELHGQLWMALRGSDPLRCYLTPSVRMGDHALPEPDIVVAEPHDDSFLPLGKIRLVVEVSDTTLERDAGRKLRLYASAGVPEYWIVDVNARVIHQSWSPRSGEYLDREEIGFGAPILAKMIAKLEVSTAGL